MTTEFEQAAARVAAGADHHAEAAALVAQMTLDEQLWCLDGDTEAWPGLFDMMQGGYHRHTFPAAVVERLGIPGIHFSDGPRGCVVGPKTCFPVSMARAASFDVDLERRIGEAIGAELRDVGATYYGGVCVNLLRHPGWGRAQETYGEEPMLVGEMGHALASGAQQHVMACVKHFALNSMENARFRVDVRADERALHEVYLPHFRRIVDGGVASVMSAYNAVNGAFCGEHHELLTGVLRGEWGFDGFVTSDFIFGLRDPVGSVRAGLDIEMPFRQQRAPVLADAIADGRLDRSEVVAAVERIVATLLRFHPVTSRPADPGRVLSDAHRALAREAAQRSMVLLRNDGVLPLPARDLRRVAVLGRLAAVPNLGDRGSSDVIAPAVVTPLDGLRAALPDVDVVHDARDTSIAENADVAIVVVGYTHVDEGEYIDAAGTAGLMGDHFPPMSDADRAAIAAASPAPAPAPPAAPADGDDEMAELPDTSGFAPGGDRRNLRLSSDDEALVRAVAATNPNTVVVVMGGSAVVMEAWRHDVAAIVLLWYPGMEGGHALADVLLGHVAPSGRLPFSIPSDEAHLPHWDPDAGTEVYDLWHGHWKLTRDGHTAAYPFGYGLSYTTFALRELVVDADGHAAEVAVENTGAVDADAVVQFYGGMPESRHERPAERLIGFVRVHVPAGDVVRVETPLDLRQLDVRDGTTWITEGGTYRITAALHVGDPHALHTDLVRHAASVPAR
ncbi:MAG: glycoside hydrolase family 3 C-terminal domain-containing protein [Acidimicrobiales bacterium]|nr:glycoside hydrolase family 3 C-terminal domain-containing protein [Acidimicrobiales bacterium]MCB9395290.1 glycoside hydrolase family 3 C-terminal domain-containing protein [Acidimicrobiaceae bacterium]